MMQAKEKSKLAFNQQAATYDEDMKGQHARNFYPVLLEKLSGIPYNAVLDLGCGTGAVLQSIIDKDSNKRAYGLDLSENMLQIAKEKLNDRVTLVLGDSDNLPFENEFFEVVYCNEGDVKMYSEKEICSLLSLSFHNITWKKANHTSFVACGTK